MSNTPEHQEHLQAPNGPEAGEIPSSAAKSLTASLDSTDQTYRTEEARIAKKHQVLEPGDIVDITGAAENKETLANKEAEIEEAVAINKSKNSLNDLESSIAATLPKESNQSDRIDPSIGAQSTGSHNEELTIIQAAKLGLQAPEKNNIASSSQSFADNDGILA